MERSALFRVLFEPADDLVQAAHAVQRLAVAGQLVVLTVEDDQAGVHPLQAQGLHDLS